MASQKAVVVGAGFSGLSAACFLAKAGFEVTVLEKNSMPGGRARKFEQDGFTYDMGPSWYWMPDVFDRFFEQFSHKTSDFYQLKRLSPSYRIVWGQDEATDVPASFDEMVEMFEAYETGAGQQLKSFLKEAEFKYKTGVGRLVYKKSASPLEFLDFDLLKSMFRLHIFQSFHTYIRKFFKNPKLLQLLEFPVLFLGGTPQTTPALYSLMNYGDIMLGTWYPEGGFYKVAEAMYKLATSLGVKFEFNTPVDNVIITARKITSVTSGTAMFDADVVINAADYHHFEQHILPSAFRTYSANYWDKRVLSPSALIFYLGFNTRLPGILHHTLLFDEDFTQHAANIYDNPQWPQKPSIYISATSKTDDSVAPEGYENLMVLIPVAPGLEDTPEMRDKLYNYIIQKLTQLTGINVITHLVYKRSYAHNDFISDYNAYKGNAYGLANTLMQTAFLKPKMQSRKLSNLYNAGQLTVPGPGVPPAIISGEVAANEIIKQFKSKKT